MRFLFSGIILFHCLLSGCAQHSPDTRFYLLSNNENTTPNEQGKFTIAVEAPVMAEYLDRPQLIVHEAKQQVTMLEFERWAEPLGESIPRVIAEGITHTVAAGGGKAMYRPPRAMRVNYWLHLNVDRFDFTPGQVDIRIYWMISSRDGKQDRDGLFHIKRGFSPKGDYGNGVEVANAILTELSAEIGRSVLEIFSNQ